MQPLSETQIAAVCLHQIEFFACLLLIFCALKRTIFCANKKGDFFKSPFVN